MANNVGRWSGQATLDAGGFSAGVKAMEKSAQHAKQNVGKSFDALKTGVGSSLNGLMGITSFGGMTIAGGLGITAPLQLATSAISSMMGTINKEVEFGFLNQQLGTSIEWLSAFRTVAAEAGVGGERFAAGISRLHQTLGNAELGSAEARGAFLNIGITWDELAGQGFDAQLLRIADAIGATENRAVRARVAVELFGREGGRQFLRLMQEAGGLQAAIANAIARGGFITDEQQATFERADDSIDQLATSWERLNRVVSSFFATQLDRIVVGARGSFLARLEAPSAAEQARLRREAEEAARREAQFAAQNAGLQAMLPELDLQGNAALAARFGAQWQQVLLGQNVQNFFEGIEQAALEANAAMAAAQLPPALAQGIQQNLGGMNLMANAARQLAVVMAAGVNLNNLTPQQIQANNTAFDQQIGALRVQAATLGMSAEAAQRFKNELAGMTAEQLRQIDVINSAIAARNAQIANEQNAMNQIQQMTQAARTPLMDFQRDMRRIFTGGLGTREMGANIEQAIGRLGMQQPQRSRVAGMEQGSVEAVSLINQRDTAQISAIDRVRETLQTAIRVQEAQRDFQRDTLDAVRQLRRNGEFADVLGN